MRRGFRSSILIELLVLLVGGRRQLHFIAYLLFWPLAMPLRENGKLSIVLHYLVAVQDFLDDLVVRSWVLEEWVVHLASSSWVDS